MTAEETSAASPPPPAPAAATAPDSPQAPRRFPVVRVGLGLLLVAGAIALVMWPRGQQLELSWRLTESLPRSKQPVRELQEVAAGESAALRMIIKTGPDAPQGARLVCNAQSRPRVLISGGRDLVFARAVAVALDPGDEIPVMFTVEEGAVPGPREVTIDVEAELEVKGQAVLRSVGLRRKITVKVVAARRRPATGEKNPKPD
jgi:hypothetical protein